METTKVPHGAGAGAPSGRTGQEVREAAQAERPQFVSFSLSDMKLVRKGLQRERLQLESTLKKYGPGDIVPSYVEGGRRGVIARLERCSALVKDFEERIERLHASRRKP